MPTETNTALAVEAPQRRAVRTEPLAPWPAFDEQIVDAVSAVLRSGKVNYWTGPEGRAFEKEYADYVGRRHAVAVANGTVALELALIALGIGPGDDVIVTPRTFVASASAVVMRGATPVFADIDRDSQNITAETIEAALTPNTKAVIAVHLGGWPCDMDPIMALAEKRGFAVIEDCAQAHGASYKGRPVGSLGHIAAFSFCQDKILTTGGEGGLVLMDDDEMWERAWGFKDHGKSYDAVFRRDHPPGFRWLHESFGTNWRMTEMQSVIGRQILPRLDDWVAKRRRHARMLNDAFSELPGLRVTLPPPDIDHAYYKYYVFAEPSELAEGWDRDRIMNAVSDLGIPCYSGSCSEIYLEKAFETSGLRPPERLPVARELGDTSLMLLVHPTLDDETIQQTCEAVTMIMREAT